MPLDVIGLSEKNKAQFVAIVEPFADSIEQICVFGSRADGTARSGSDLDILVSGPIDLHTMLHLGVAFEESDFPFRVDLLHERELTDPGLRAVIIGSARQLMSTEDIVALHRK